MTRRPTVTRGEITEALERLAPMLARAEIIPEGATLALNEGSPTNGRAWRLYYREAGSYGEHTIPIAPLDHGWPMMGYLGWSKREALETIHETTANAADERKATP